MLRSQITSITIHRLAIPMRHRVSHAAAERAIADPMVVQIELADGGTGFGETLARSYVTGETTESVPLTIEQLFVPALLAFHPESFPEALEQIDALPMENEDGSVATAARAGVELALLDAYSHSFKRPLADMVGWLGLPGLGPPGSSGKVRFSGVLAAEEPARIRRQFRLMRLYGLRDFKLKVGFDGDVERLQFLARLAGRSLKSGRVTLRLDANGGWDEDRGREVLSACSEIPLVCVEQPLARGSETDLSRFRDKTGVPVMVDESLVTRLDAEELIEAGAADWFNLRLAKNGGLMATMRLAALARRHGIGLMLGSLVGETSILSAAGRRFLEFVPGVRFAEGSFGTLLLREDIVNRSVRFGCGGRWRPFEGLGWGVRVEPDRLSRLSVDRPIGFRL